MADPTPTVRCLVIRAVFKFGQFSSSHNIIRRKKKIKVVKIRYPSLDMEKLDPDMQLEIISRLPFKEAVQCRCVCKSWLTLLDDNFLINIHAKTLLKHNYEYHHALNSSSRLSFISMPRTYTSYTNDVDIIFGVYNDDDDYDMCSYKETSFNYNYTYPKGFRHAMTMVTSCKGLICWSKVYNILVYNPITKEHKNLRIGNCDNLFCGFGYHPTTKQYKILKRSFNYGSGRFVWFEIYTLGTTGKDKWRKIKAPGRCFDYHVPGVHVDGALYWITDYFKDKKKRMIISFDLGDDEEFRIITSLPPPVSDNISEAQQSSSHHYKLEESQGSLYLIVDHFEHSSEDGDPYIEIWLMMKKEKKKMMPEKTETTKKKYKRDHRHHYSWTKVMKISTDHHGREEYEFAGLSKSGKVLFWRNSVLTCFDPKTERFESLSSSSGAYGRTFVPHVNSLVSLKALQAKATTL